jgi:hypothetical protein
MIRTWRPRERSTGPKTREGKRRNNQNAVVHGGYSQDSKRIKDLLRECKESIEFIRQ